MADAKPALAVPAIRSSSARIQLQRAGRAEERHRGTLRDETTARLVGQRMQALYGWAPRVKSAS